MSKFLKSNYTVLRSTGVCVRACVRACVHSCVHACMCGARMRWCMHACVCVYINVFLLWIVCPSNGKLAILLQMFLRF